MPPPVPVDSMIGAGKPLVCAKRSITIEVKGKTVDEPTMRISSRACAVPANAIVATPASRMVFFIIRLLGNLVPGIL